MAMPKGYIFAELDIHDTALFYNEYMEQVMAPLRDYGAKFLAGSNAVDVIEGERNVRRIVLLEFDSLQRARDFYYSSAYQDVIGLRFRSAATELYMFEGTFAQ